MGFGPPARGRPVRAMASRTCPGCASGACRARPWEGALRALIACFILAACAAPRVERPDWPDYRAFVVPQPILPFEATGSARFEYRGEKQTGSVIVQGAMESRLLMRVISPVLGTTALEVRITPAELLVVDFGSESYYLGANSAEQRLKLFSIDMSPQEFMIVLTGRVPRTAFEAGGGRIEGTFADFSAEGAYYRFALNQQGLPDSAVKEAPGGRGWRVEYREYQPVPVGAGALLLPRKVRVYVDDATPRLVLGIAEFQLWSDGGAPPFSLHPPEGMRFEPLDAQ